MPIRYEGVWGLYEEDLPNGNVIVFKDYNGTMYHAQTRLAVVKCLDALIHKYPSRVIRLWFGDCFGKSWLEEHGVQGTVARTNGRIKSPILLEKSDIGGPIILDHCIVKIMDVKSKVNLYKHENFSVPELKVFTKTDTVKGFIEEMVYSDDGELVARFDKQGEGEKWVKMMKGE